MRNVMRRRPILSAGLALGVGTGLWMFVMGFSGLYLHPTLASLFMLVVLLELGALWWGLSHTAQQGKGYAAQVGAGTLMALVACPVIFCSSLLFTGVVFPEYFSELEAMQRQMLADAGRSTAQIDAELQAGAASRASLPNALAGVVGTLVTGLAFSPILAIFLRRREDEDAQADSSDALELAARAS